VAAQRRRQAIGLAIDIDRRRLTAIGGNDRDALLLVRRQLAEGIGDLLLQIAPA
jgi:hypothetical protein